MGGKGKNSCGGRVTTTLSQQPKGSGRCGKKFECLFSSLLHFLSVLICDVISFVMFFQNYSRYDICTVAIKHNHQGRNSGVKQIREGTVAM